MQFGFDNFNVLSMTKTAQKGVLMKKERISTTLPKDLWARFGVYCAKKQIKKNHLLAEILKDICGDIDLDEDRIYRGRHSHLWL